jgi:hypothetical protein
MIVAPWEESICQISLQVLTVLTRGHKLSRRTGLLCGNLTNEHGYLYTLSYGWSSISRMLYHRNSSNARP